MCTLLPQLCLDHLEWTSAALLKSKYVISLLAKSETKKHLTVCFFLCGICKLSLLAEQRHSPPAHSPPPSPGPSRFLFCSFPTRSHPVIWPFWFCPYVLALFPNILPLVIWPTFYLRILPSSVSGSLKSSQFSQVCLMIVILFSLHIRIVCVYDLHIISLRKQIALVEAYSKTKPSREQI